MENENILDDLSVDEKITLAMQLLVGSSKGRRKKDTADGEHTEKNTSVPSPHKEKRTRKFSCSTYIEPQGLKRFLESSPFVQHWAYCTHDRDICTNDDGDRIIDAETGEPCLKETHTHFLLYTYDAKTSSAIKKIFERFSIDYYKARGGVAQNTFVENCNDMVSQWRYLIHADSPEKVLYDVNERICDDFVYWSHLETTNGLNDAANNKFYQILLDVMRGAHPVIMSQKYGGSYVLNAPKIDYLVRKIEKMEKIQRGMSLKEYFRFSLENSQFDQEKINAFFIVFDYLQSDVFLHTGVNIDDIPLNQYLDISKELKNICLK